MTGADDPFVLRFNRGGVTSLRLREDPYPTEYLKPGQTLGNVILRTRTDPHAGWRRMEAFGSGDVREVLPVDVPATAGKRFAYRGRSRGVHGLRDLDLDVEFRATDHRLDMSLTIRNRHPCALEIGDLALPLPFNNDFQGSNLANYTTVVARQGYVAGHGSFQVWMRPNGEGPFLVMTPLPGTKLEFYEQHQPDATRSPVLYWVYVHSRATGGETPGTWRQPHTSFRLAPEGSGRDTVSYGFRFRWARDQDHVRQILYEEGGFDVWVAPGMTVAEDMETRFSLRTRQADYRLEPEFPAQTQIERIASPDPERDLYTVAFSRLGENRITIRYGDDRYYLLEFFVTQPIATLLKKRCRFLVDRQQHRCEDEWYDGLYSVWDMRGAVLRSPHDTDGFDGWYGYVLCCDDTALPKAPFLAAKNVHYPVRAQIESLEYYIERFLWGKLQRTDRESPWPFGLYGVPNWFENRYSEHGWDSGGRGLDHIWRSYDYPHVVMLYFHMYEIARAHPAWVRHASAREYLWRAYGTARTYFEIQAQIDFLPPDRNPYWAYTLGMYNEVVMESVYEALAREGWPAEAAWLRGEWEKKVTYFVYDDPYPFDSEYPFDTTAFESTYVFARYGLENAVQSGAGAWHDRRQDKWYRHPDIHRADFEAFMERQRRANVALRGWLEPAFYLMGSDNRAGDSTLYALSYMSQAGGWPLLEYAVRYAADPLPMVNLGYASLLSSWALMNAGPPEADYGHWYPGEAQDGACGWAFTPEKRGWMWIRRFNERGPWYYDGEIEIGLGAALRGMATVLVDDPILGLFAYGGVIERVADGLRVYPRDGLGKRFHNLAAGYELMDQANPAPAPVRFWSLKKRP